MTPERLPQSQRAAKLYCRNPLSANRQNSETSANLRQKLKFETAAERLRVMPRSVRLQRRTQQYRHFGGFSCRQDGVNWVQDGGRPSAMEVSREDIPDTGSGHTLRRAFRGIYMHVLASRPNGIPDLFCTAAHTAVHSEALIDYAVANRLWPSARFCRALGRTGSLQLIRHATATVPRMKVNAEVLIGLIRKLDVPLLRRVQAVFKLPELNQVLRINDWCAAGLKAAAAGDDGHIFKWIGQQISALPGGPAARKIHCCYSGKCSLQMASLKNGSI
ncbi:hypothetical protein JKP88DRAFT_249594 [Tribonema minus]|uniref:Uncharacterized protein n=1 Tax=Tribonema minus TaxID=303371 RepID=A0A836C8Q8_9STRA|nr:hypothetical protein JKP88DRAFT_249594 [Tribonema minus]